MPGEMTAETIEQLFAAATESRRHAYAPYSGFQVGAAVLTGDGQIFTGANVENASYSLTICAERAAVFTAVSAGSRTIVAIAVVTGAAQPTPPCGACRQVLREFLNPEAGQFIVMNTLHGTRRTTDIDTLLPDSFGPVNINTKI